jgi:LPS export ABC transporter protein LptC
VKGHLLLFVLAAAGLLFVAFQMGRSGQAPVRPAGDEAQTESGYDFIARGVAVEQSDEQGRTLYAFTADNVQQQSGEQALAAHGLTFHYESPRENADTAPQHWTVRADTAQLPEQGGVLSLAGNVEARGTPPGTGAELTVRTDRLDYDLRGERLRSDALVRFDWNGREVTGTGLDADLRRGKFELESSVRGRIAP